MKKTIFAVLLCLATVIYAQTTLNNMKTTTQTSDLAILRELNGKFIRNFINQDTNAHNELIHADFVCIQSSGVIVGRDEYMKGWAHGYKNANYTSFDYTDELIRIFGNTALVRSKTVYTKEVDGKTITGASVYTDTYIKENGRWWCVQAQITGIR
jgi:ketosteroid isomerase-like protein